MKLTKILLAALLAGCSSEPSVSDLWKREAIRPHTDAPLTYRQRESLETEIRAHTDALRNHCLLYQTEEGLFLARSALGLDIEKISSEQVLNAKIAPGCSSYSFLKDTLGSQDAHIIDSQGKEHLLPNTLQILDWTSDHELWYLPSREHYLLNNYKNETFTIDDAVKKQLDKSFCAVCYDTNTNRLTKTIPLEDRSNIRVNTRGNILVWQQKRKNKYEKDHLPDITVYDGSGKRVHKIVLRYEKEDFSNSIFSGLDADQELLAVDVTQNTEKVFTITALVSNPDSQRVMIYSMGVLDSDLQKEKGITYPVHPSPLATIELDQRASCPIIGFGTGLIGIAHTPDNLNIIYAGEPQLHYILSNNPYKENAYLIEKTTRKLADLFLIPSNTFGVSPLLVYLSDNTLYVNPTELDPTAIITPLPNAKILRLFDVKPMK